MQWVYANKWYIHHPDSVRENDKHKPFWNIEIKTDHPILTRGPHLMIGNKNRTCRILIIAVPAEHRVKIKENEKRDKYQDLDRELKNKEHEVDGDTNCNWFTQNNSKRMDEGIRRFRNQRTTRDHSDKSILKISQNTEKSHGDLLSLKIQ